MWFFVLAAIGAKHRHAPVFGRAVGVTVGFTELDPQF